MGGKKWEDRKVLPEAYQTQMSNERADQKKDARIVSEEILNSNEEQPEEAGTFDDLSKGAQLLVDHLVHRIIESGFTAQSRLDEPL